MTVIPRRVRMGIKTQMVALASRLIPCFIMALKPRIRFLVVSRAATAKKKMAQNAAMGIMRGFSLMPAGAAKPTAFMANVNEEII